MNTNEYRFPPVELLAAPEKNDYASLLEETAQKAEKLMELLETRGIDATLSGIFFGGRVSRYVVTPAPGVSILQITELSEDIALYFGAESVSMEAPVRGKKAVGVDIPNKTQRNVYLRSLIESEKFTSLRDSLPLALGRDIEGSDIYCCISQTSHLLIAASAGTEKSVCINSMLLSLIYNFSPEDVRLILIDPKCVEFDEYNGLPHLLTPVVTDPDKIIDILRRAEEEMDRRFSILEENGLEMLEDYNAAADEDPELQKLPHIIIVIDELADLNDTARKACESAIQRLTQYEDSVGIHLILAAQHSTVDVFTSAITSNYPKCIAFSVRSPIESRFILNEAGAEKLTGQGDMLFKEYRQKPLRVQGCFVSDDEVKNVVKFVKENNVYETKEQQT